MSTESKAKPEMARLTYWSGRGNAELVRLMMEACGQPYEEQVYGSAAKTLSQPAEMHRMFKDGVLAFDQVPLLEIDGLRLVQKFASSFLNISRVITMLIPCLAEMVMRHTFFL